MPKQIVSGSEKRSWCVPSVRIVAGGCATASKGIVKTMPGINSQDRKIVRTPSLLNLDVHLFFFQPPTSASYGGGTAGVEREIKGPVR